MKKSRFSEARYQRGAPLSIRLDNSPEFIANTLDKWAQSKGIALNHIHSDKLTQNAFV